MAVTTDIFDTYRGPGRVVARLLSVGRREDRALAIVMVGCLLVFVAQWPRLARQAHINGEELNMLLGSTLLSWVFIMPLFLYAMGTVTHFAAKALRAKGTAYGARMALFWALLATGPVMLFQGMVAGFVGPGPALTAVEFLWFALFVWFWLAGLWSAEWGQGSDVV